MTTELEKQFFDTFGIKARIYKTSAMGMSEINHPCIFPEITDRHYLEFICITRRYALRLADTISETKNRLLRFLIDNNTLFKHQVQEIFEVER